MQSLAQLRSFPKIDLHRHLDCCMRWSTLIELAPKLGLELECGWKKQRSQFLVSEPMIDLKNVLNKFKNIQKLLASDEILERLAFEACEDAFNDGVRIVEFRYAPTFINEGNPQLSFEKIHSAFLRGISEAQKRFSIAVGLISIIQRTRSLEIAEKVCDFTIDNKDSFVGIDLADDEENFDPFKYEKIFAKAKKSGLHITIHAGEIPSSLAPELVKKCVEILGAERIGHGIHVVSSEPIMNFLIKNRISLEICPISNFLTQSIKAGQSHPIRQLYNKGVSISINSDDPGVFGTTLTDEYDLLQRDYQFTSAEFKAINQKAFESSFIDTKIKSSVWDAR